MQASDLIADRALSKDDIDAFRNDQIAAQVAGIVDLGGDRVNIALFGAWGSGKSSMCGLIERHLPDDIKLVPYDAWKSGGQNLQRNFISHAATKLGYLERRPGDGERSPPAVSPRLGRLSGYFKSVVADDENRQFHRGLYESRRTTELSIPSFLASNRWRALGFIVVATLVVAAAVAEVVSGLDAWIGPHSYSHNLSSIGATLAAVLWPLLIAIVAIFRLADGARVDVEQTAPSADEEFSRIFDVLVRRATSDRLDGETWRRLVFFIDELDRCSKDDVVATLVALKTFLDQDKCIFIVAADREVLEEALDRLPQSTPIREAEPYYSSASAFLDKVFQHQIELPPLRSPRLTKFARDLVAGEGGIWAELRSQPDVVTLDRVMSALIPGHVRSPRRVKVLLNNFATTARIAQSRGIAWPARAREIAKLTVLRTEFPALARDLHLEPRLPSMLLDVPSSPPAAAAELLTRHALQIQASASLPRQDTSGDGGDETGDRDLAVVPEGSEDPDRLLLPVGVKRTADARLRLALRQRDDLRLYLRRMQIAGVPDPGRDLLYLEPGGAPIGFIDDDLGQLIENEAADDPMSVVAAIREAVAEDQVAAARMLAGLAEQNIADERSSLVAALCHVVAGLGDNAAPVATAASQAVRLQLADESLPDGCGVGAVWIGVLANDDEVESAGFADDTLLVDRNGLAQLWPLLPRISDANAEAVNLALGATATDPDGPMLAAMRRLPPTEAEALISDASAAMVAGLAALLESADEPDAGHAGRDAVIVAADRLFDAALSQPSPQPARTLNWALLGATVTGTYEAVRSHAQDLLPRLDAAVRNRHALRALTIAPSSDWREWADLLVDEASPSEPDTRARSAIAAVISGLAAATPAEQAGASEVVRRIAATGFAVDLPSEVTSSGEAVAVLLEPADWVNDPVLLDRTARFWQFGEALVDVGAISAESFSDLVDADVSRVLADMQPQQAAALCRLAPNVPGQVVRNIVVHLAEGVPWSLPLRLALAHRAVGVGVETVAVSIDEIRSMVQAHAGETGEALALWLDLGPSLDEVGVVWSDGPPQLPVVSSAFDGWLAGLTKPQRTTLWLEFVAAGVDTSWRSLVRQAGVDEHAVVLALVERVGREGTAGARANAAELIYPFEPAGDAGKATVALAATLLTSELKLDVETGSRLVLASSRHRVGELRELFRAAADAGRAPGGSLRKQLESDNWLPRSKKSVLPRNLFRRDR